MMRGWGAPEQGCRKGPWTPEEDKLLSDYVSLHGEGGWSCVARCAGLNRIGKSCRLRWVNYLRPGLKRGQITPQEEGIIIELHALWGNKWSTIARYLPGRTDNEIKNYWRTHFKKKSGKISEKQDRRKIRRNRNQEQENGAIHRPTTPQLTQLNINNDHNVSDLQGNNLQQEATNNSFIAASLNMGDNNHLCTSKTSSYQDIESWVDTFAIDGLWGGLWNLDDSLHAPAALEQGTDGSCKIQKQATIVYPNEADHTVDLWNGGYIF